MRYVAAYLLAVLGGNEAPTSKDLKKILDSVGIETDDERLNKVLPPHGPPAAALPCPASSSLFHSARWALGALPAAGLCDQTSGLLPGLQHPSVSLALSLLCLSFTLSQIITYVIS